MIARWQEYAGSLTISWQVFNAKGCYQTAGPDRGFGFIKSGDEADIFFHRSELQGTDFTARQEGQSVEYDIGKGRDNRSQAVKVRLAQAE